MTALVGSESAETNLRGQLAADARRLARIMLVSVPIGMLTVGVVARLVMRLLAALNPEAAGLLSDDGFVIDQVTLRGSLNLLGAGAFFGALSGVLYTGLASLKTGPGWFQRLSLSVGAAVVVGSQVVHTEGVDFVVLDPYLLPILLFVGVPLVHVLVLDVLVERLEAAGRPRGRAWTVAGLALCVLMAPLVAALAVARTVQLLGRGHRTVGRWLDRQEWPWLARAGLAVMFGWSLVSLVQDAATLA